MAVQLLLLSVTLINPPALRPAVLTGPPLTAHRSFAPVACAAPPPRGAAEQCGSTAPAPAAAPPGKLRRALRRAGGALAVTAASVLLRVPGTGAPAIAAQVAADPAAAPAPAAVPKKQKQVDTSGGTMVTTAVTIGGLMWWSVKSVKKENEEEQKRIKEEFKRMEEQRLEWRDIGGQVTVDEDLFASLKKRMNSTDDAPPDVEGKDLGEGPSSGPSSGGGGGGGRPKPPNPTGPKDSGGGAATLEPPGDEPPADTGPPLASDEDAERLKRMFDSS